MGFQIALFNGEDPQAQYDAIEHDPLTFYILASGKGYIGDQLLFNADNAIDFSDIEGTREKLVYTEDVEEGVQIIHSTLFDDVIEHSTRDGKPFGNIQPMMMADNNGITVRTEETITHFMDKEEGDALWDEMFINCIDKFLDNEKEWTEKEYLNVPALLNTVVTWQGLMSILNRFWNARVDQFVRATVDDGTSEEE